MVTSVAIGASLVAAFGVIIYLNNVAAPSHGDTQTATYYVSPAGSDTNQGTSKDLPFANIQHALLKADAGDVIELADGEYKQDFKTVRPGTKAAPITIKGSRDSIVYGNENNRIIEINHDYITLDGFHINGQSGNGTSKEDFKDKLIYAIGTEFKNGVEGVKLNNLLIENAGGECVRFRYFAKHNEISNNTIKNCGIHDFRFSAGGKNGEAIYIGTAPEQRKDGKNPTADADESSENWVHHNTIESNGNECVDIKEGATKNLIEHNTCSGQRDPKSGGMDARGEYNIFRYNIIRDNLGAGVRLGGDGDNDGTHNDVYDNTIQNNRAGAIRILRWPQGKICGNSLEANGESDDESSAVDPSVNCN